MKRMFLKLTHRICLGIFFCGLLGASAVFADDYTSDLPKKTEVISNPSDTSDKTLTKTPVPPQVAAKVLLGDLKAIEKIHQKTLETKEGIKKQIETVEVAKKEAEKVVEEKKILEKEALITEHAAAVVKQELEVAKKEARISGSDEATTKIQDLSRKSGNLDAQAQLSKEKLLVAEQKAKLALESVEKSNLTIEALNKELTALKKEKVLKEGWIPKLAAAGAVFGVGILFLFLLNWGLRKFELAITDKDAIRETEINLRLKTLSSLLRWTGSLIILGSVFYIALANAGIDMAPLLAGAGIVGLAFGFGGQYLVRDIINGMFILIENQYGINDIVRIGEHSGVVESVNLRLTKLRNFEGSTIYIPNGEIKTVVNLTEEFSQAVLNIGVAYKENVDQVIEVLKQLGKEMRRDDYFKRLILDEFEVLGVDDFASSQVTIKSRVKTLPSKQWEVSREFRRRVKNKFDELDIEIPFPHVTLYQGKDKDTAKLAAWQTAQKEKEDQSETNKGTRANKALGGK